MGGDVKGVNVSVPNDEVLEGADEEVVGTVYGSVLRALSASLQVWNCEMRI